MFHFELFFDWLAGASLRASLLALAVLCLQTALRTWISATWRYALWAPVLLVLLLPVLPERPWSLTVEPAAPAPLVEQAPAPVAMVETTPGQAVNLAPAGPAFDWKGLACGLWLTGAAVGWVIISAGYLRALRQTREGSSAAEAEIYALVRQEAARMGLRHPPRLRWLSADHSPAVAGLWRPLLLLPAGFPEGFTPGEARLVLRHELMHLKRRDLPLNLLLGLLQCLHWCNPVLWLAFARMRVDRELACDAAVLAAETGRARAEYGHALLKLQDSARAPVGGLALVGLFSGREVLRGRIQRIAQFRATGKAGHLLGAGLLLAILLAGATRAQTPQAKPAPDARRADVLLQVHLLESDQPAAPGLRLLQGEAYDRLMAGVGSSQGSTAATSFRITTALDHPASLDVRKKPQEAQAEEGGNPWLKLKMLPKLDGEHLQLGTEVTVENLAKPNQPAGTTSKTVQVSVRMHHFDARLAEKEGLVFPLGVTPAGRQLALVIQADAVEPKTGKPTRFSTFFSPSTAPKTTAGATAVSLKVHWWEYDGPVQQGLDKLAALMGQKPPAPALGEPPAKTAPAMATLSGVLTAPQFQTLLASITQSKTGRWFQTEPSQRNVASGEETTLDLPAKAVGGPWKAQVAVGTKAAVLDLLLTHQAELKPGDFQAVTTSVSIWNDQTVMMTGSHDGKAYALFITASQAVAKADKAGASKEHWQNKLDALVLKQISLREVTAQQAAAVLTAKAGESDNAETNPALKGCPVRLSPEAQNTPVTLSLDLRDVPMQEAVRYVAELASLTVTLDDQGVLLKPVGKGK